ncbi:MAG: hypothetical protein NC223_09965 [Butyrivibrio sp.]|nr:hypothetical protein [Butyrivibrio sp.]
MQKSSSKAGSENQSSSDNKLYQATASNGYFLSLTFKNGQFRFSDPACSILFADDKGVYGKYSVEGNTVTLLCDESDDMFVLTLSEDKLYLNKDISSSLNIIKSTANFEKLFKDTDVCFVPVEQLDE